MYCDACAHPNRSGARFCAACGQPLPVSQVQATTLSGGDTLSDDAISTMSGQATRVPGSVPPSEAETVLESPAAAAGYGLFAEFVGQTVRGYRIERKLGEGGMGAVFEATQLQLKRRVAIKVLPPAMARDQSLIERFSREAQILASLDNAYIVPIFDMFTHMGLFFIVMGYAGGGSVKQLLRKGTLSESRAATLTYQAALGLHAGAQEGIVHRDIKPDNLLLTRKGRLKIADFGLAKADGGGSALTRTGSVMGTPPYMSPEQWEDGRKTDHRSDLYSLGCAFYEMLVGAPPFTGTTPANFLKAHLMEKIPDVRASRPDLAPETARILSRLLAKDPSARFADGQELARALQPLLGSTDPVSGSDLGIELGVPTQEMPTVLEQPPRKRKLWAWLVAIVCLLLLPGLLFHGPLRDALFSTEPGPPPDPGPEQPQGTQADPQPVGAVRFVQLTPATNQTLTSSPVLVSGKLVADAGALPGTLSIDGQPVTIGPDGRFSHPLELADGRHTVRLQAGAHEQELAFSVDTTPPEISKLLPDALRVKGPAFPFEVLVVADDVAEVRIAGEVVVATVAHRYRTTLERPHGAHPIEVVARDLAGNQDTKSWTVEVDSEGPVIEVLSPAQGTVLDVAEVQVRLRCDAPDLAALTVSGQPVVADGKDYSIVIPVGPGETSLELIARDQVGNETRDQLLVRLEPTVESFGFVSPAEGALFAGGEVEVWLQAQLPEVARVTVSGVEAARDGDAYRAVLTLAHGSHLLEARAMRPDGSYLQAARRVRVDLRDPELHFLRPLSGDALAGPVAVALRVEDDELVSVTVAGVEARNLGDSWEVELELAEGEHQLEAVATDRAGHETRKQITISVDRSPPRVTVRAEGSGADAVIVVESDEPLGQMRVAGGPWREVTGTSLRLPSPVAEGLVHVEVKDRAGNLQSGQTTVAPAAPRTIRVSSVRADWWNATAEQTRAAGSHRLPVAISAGRDLRLVLVPAGRFTMGSPPHEPTRQADEQAHEVELTYSFYIGDAEVSQEEFRALMAYDPSSDEGEPRQPVENLTWVEAVEFCNRLSEREGLEPAYAIDEDGVRFLGLHRLGYRLPTEAEWEYACRAGTTGEFWLGANLRGREANYDGKDPMPGYPEQKKYGKPRNARDHKPNAFGLFNTHGNVYEWCNDWYGPYPEGPVSDPTGPAEGARRVIRGGSYTSAAGLCRSASRGSRRPGDSQGFIGFRVARTIP